MDFGQVGRAAFAHGVEGAFRGGDAVVDDLVRSSISRAHAAPTTFDDAVDEAAAASPFEQLLREREALDVDAILRRVDEEARRRDEEMSNAAVLGMSDDVDPFASGADDLDLFGGGSLGDDLDGFGGSFVDDFDAGF